VQRIGRNGDPVADPGHITRRERLLRIRPPRRSRWPTRYRGIPSARYRQTQQNILRVWQKVIASQQLNLAQTELPLASGEAAGNHAVMRAEPAGPSAPEGNEAAA
jgi:hypothetical protein